MPETIARHHRHHGRGTQGRGSCNQTTMERPPRPEPLHDRLARATNRLNAATARMSEAQELLTEAKARLARARLARARLALAKTTARDIHGPPADDEPMKPGGDPMNGSGPR
jgi:hypothetical protein